MKPAAGPGSMYLGLMSGTSMDGIDAAIVSLAGSSCNMVAARHHPYEKSLNTRIKAVVLAPASASLDDWQMRELFRISSIATS